MTSEIKADIVRQAAEIVREFEQTGLTDDERVVLREILEDWQASGEESQIPGRAAELPKAASLWDRLKSEDGKTLLALLTAIITLLGVTISFRALEQTPETRPQVQIEQVIR